MEEVSGGNLQAQIPYETRGDEVGDQARALAVFRDGLAEAEQMREQRRRKSAPPPSGARKRCTPSPTGSRRRWALWWRPWLRPPPSFRAPPRRSRPPPNRPPIRRAPWLRRPMRPPRTCRWWRRPSRNSRPRRTRSAIASPAPPRSQGRAVSEVDQTNGRMTELRGSADQIGNIVGMIDTIAGQHQLLALNATIESARAARRPGLCRGGSRR